MLISAANAHFILWGFVILIGGLISLILANRKVKKKIPVSSNMKPIISDTITVENLSKHVAISHGGVIPGTFPVNLNDDNLGTVIKIINGDGENLTIEEIEGLDKIDSDKVYYDDRLNALVVTNDPDPKDVGVYIGEL